jgi:hypothetical protein
MACACCFPCSHSRRAAKGLTRKANHYGLCFPLLTAF